MSDIAPSIVEQIIQNLYLALADGPATLLETGEEVPNFEKAPDKWPAITITPFDDAPAEEAETTSIRVFKFYVEIVAYREESIPARTVVDRLYVWSTNAIMHNEWLDQFVISITEGPETWEFPAPGFGYKATEYSIRYARSVEDPSQ